MWYYLVKLKILLIHQFSTHQRNIHQERNTATYTVELLEVAKKVANNLSSRKWTCEL